MFLEKNFVDVPTDSQIHSETQPCYKLGSRWRKKEQETRTVTNEEACHWLPSAVPPGPYLQEHCGCGWSRKRASRTQSGEGWHSCHYLGGGGADRRCQCPAISHRVASFPPKPHADYAAGMRNREWLGVATELQQRADKA